MPSAHFGAATHVSVTTSAHTTKSDLLDIEKVVKAVQEDKILIKQANPRYHHLFPKMNLDPLDNLKMKNWIRDKIFEFRTQKGALADCATYEDDSSD